MLRMAMVIGTIGKVESKFIGVILAGAASLSMAGFIAKGDVIPS